MRKTALCTAATVALLGLASSRSAEASRGDCGPLCEAIALPIAITMGVGVVGLYAAGTGYYVVHDLDREPHGLQYHGSELMIHGTFTAMSTQLMVGAIRDGQTGSAIAAGAFTALHGTLAVHGLAGVFTHRDEFGRANPTLVHWTLGTVYTLDTLAWAADWPEPHSRRYGVAEVAVNAPLAAGLGLLARDRFQDDSVGAGILYSGMAAVSALYVAQGISTIVRPHPSTIDLNIASIAPTIVDDGHAGAPGLGASGRF